LADEIAQNMLKLAKRVMPLPEMTPLEEEEVQIGQDRWRVFATPGHSDGHLCFYHSGQKLLIAGDHLLDPITPNISMWPHATKSPLQDYLQSLERTAQLDISISYGGHGKPIPHVRERIGQLVKHHEERLERMLNFAKEGKTAYETAAELFREKALTAHQWRFAIAETIAHLEYLTEEGKLTKDQQAGVTVYSGLPSRRGV
jgi:glyoxylase-like metal-dependent hydrolase (beta-lactamase superfamily II)